MISPIIHINGTPREQLKQPYMDCYALLEDAAESLRQAAPNGRDYYLVPGRMQESEAQHVRRLKIIRDLQAELEQQCEAIDAA